MTIPAQGTRAPMNALSSFLECLTFAVACVVGWVLFPILLIGGTLALLAYASILELSLPLFRFPSATAIATQDPVAAREAARRLCGSP